jgi:SOS-response transcriptional repressor LexA
VEPPNSSKGFSLVPTLGSNNSEPSARILQFALKYLDGSIVFMDYALQPRDGDVIAALIDGTESTLKIHSRQSDEITLTPIEIKRHSPRNFHASRVTIQGVLIEIVHRTTRRKR